MAKWIPGVAVFGLICLMVLPAPVIWGVLIGGICIVVIALSALVWALDAMTSRMLARYARWRPPASGRARSGKATTIAAKKVAAGKPAARRA